MYPYLGRTFIVRRPGQSPLHFTVVAITATLEKGVRAECHVSRGPGRLPMVAHVPVSLLDGAEEVPGP